MADDDATPRIISRQEALRVGLSFYYEAKPCVRGHLSIRYVKSGNCRECAAIWFRENVERRKCYEENRRRNDPDRKKKQSAWNAARYVRKYDQIKQYRLRYYQENKECVKRQRREYRERKLADNPDVFRHFYHNRRAKKLAAPGKYSVDDLKRIYRLQHGRCAICRIQLNNMYEIDHIIPFGLGGTNEPKNIQLLCTKQQNACNQKKRENDPIDYARSLGLLL